MTTHVAVWLDHDEARIYALEPGKIDETSVIAPQHLHHRHPKGRGEAKEHPDDAKHFFHAIARSLDAADAVLIVGPSSAKLELIRYIHKHEHTLEPRIVGVETADHPTDGQLVSHARRYFKLEDRVASAR